MNSGTFQRVEYVFLVGVGGGVPHYTDFNRHVRLGDVVVSHPPENAHKQYVYLHCEKIKNSPEERANSPLGVKQDNIDSFNYRFWCPPNLELQSIAKEIWLKGVADSQNRIWEEHIQEGFDVLQNVQESEFARPPVQTDKLYMSIGTKDVIEMGHPVPPSGVTDQERMVCRSFILARLDLGEWQSKMNKFARTLQVNLAFWHSILNLKQSLSQFMETEKINTFSYVESVITKMETEEKTGSRMQLYVLLLS